MILRNRQRGFSLIEMLVVITVFSIVIIAASQSFVPLLSQSKQQSKIAATNIEGMLGLEVMRRDITHAGYGLYWHTAPTPTPIYTEISPATDPLGSTLNDNPVGVPFPIMISGGVELNGSDRLAVKSINAASNETSERWTYRYGSPVNSVQTWAPASENIGNNEYVIVVRPDNQYRYLMFTNDVPNPLFYAKYSEVMAKYPFMETTSIIFSLSTITPRLAFNRADYFISSANVPTRCAAGTGVLHKAVMNQAEGSTGFLPWIPLLDCVADMQIAYRYASDAGGYADAEADVAAGSQPLSVEESRSIREVRVYILAQEGQFDRSYAYPNSIVTVGEKVGAAVLYGRDFDFNGTVTNWQNYRWKLYTLIIYPVCLVDWTPK